MKTKLQSSIQESRTGKMVTNEVAHKILAEYERTLQLPRRRPRTLFIICLVGLVGAGKTTVAKPLSKKLDLLRIAPDEIRMLLIASGYSLWRTRGMAFTLIEKYLKKKYSITVDADCATAVTQKRLKMLGRKYGARVIWLHVRPPEKFILHKLRHFPYDGRLFRNAKHAIHVYRLRKPLHRKLNFSFIYTFDTSRKNLTGQIKEAAALINKEIRKMVLD